MTSRGPQAMNALDRRAFLQRLGLTTFTVGVGPSLLAACGSSSSSSGGKVEELPDDGKVGGTVNFLSWEGYDLPDPLKDWRTANNIEVATTFIGNHDDIQAKIKTGGAASGYDIITYYQGYKNLYSELDILTQIDESKVPNLKNLFPYFASDIGGYWTKGGVRTGVPFTFGAQGLTYDSAAMSELPSWYDLLDPKFKGKVGMVDDATGVLTMGSHLLGLDPGALKKADLAKVVDLTKKFVAQTRGVSASYGDLTQQLVSGEIQAIYIGWAAVNSFAAAAGKTTVTTSLPKEGAYSFCDSFAIPSTAKNVASVLSWINTVMDPKVNAAAAVGLVGGTTVKDAVPLLDDATRSLYPYDDLDGFLAKAPFYPNPPVDSTEFVTGTEWKQAWGELKQSAGG